MEKWEESGDDGKTIGGWLDEEYQNMVTLGFLLFLRWGRGALLELEQNVDMAAAVAIIAHSFSWFICMTVEEKKKHVFPVKSALEFGRFWLHRCHLEVPGKIL